MILVRPLVVSNFSTDIGYPSPLLCPKLTFLKGGKYPHKYLNSENFAFVDDYRCQVDAPLMIIPVTPSGVFKGDGDETAYKFRAVYVHDPKSPNNQQGNPTAYYCGTIYHKKGNTFDGCDIIKN